MAGVGRAGSFMVAILFLLIELSSSAGRRVRVVGVELYEMGYEVKVLTSHPDGSRKTSDLEKRQSSD